MAPILSCPGPEDPADPAHDSSTGGSTNPNGHADIVDPESIDALGTYDVLFETDDLLEALARTSGLYGVFADGHGTPRTVTDTAAAVETAADGGGDQPPAPPDSPSDGDHPSDDHGDHNGGGRGSDGQRRCQHGHLMLCTDDLTGWWGRPRPDTAHPVWWCPTWCARADTDDTGNVIDPTEWVHRSQSYRITPAANGTSTGTDGGQTTGPVTITVRAEKHPSRPVRFVQTIGIDGVEHTVTLTATEAQHLYRFHNLVMEGLTGHRMAA